MYILLVVVDDEVGPFQINNFIAPCGFNLIFTISIPERLCFLSLRYHVGSTSILTFHSVCRIGFTYLAKTKFEDVFP
ncbi:hypothetical protein Hdeb2414_s0013g00409161 [Helianthus debilis subsp. tardiflorus]